MDKFSDDVLQDAAARLLISLRQGDGIDQNALGALRRALREHAAASV